MPRPPKEILLSKQQTYDKLNLLGVDVDAVTIPEAISYIVERSAPGRPPSYVVKPYVEFLDNAARRSSTRELLNGAELVLADGVALTWAAHYLYAGPRTRRRFLRTLADIILAPEKLRWPLPDRMAGTNFTWPLLQTMAAEKRRIFLIGKESEAGIKATGRYLADRIPGLVIAGTMSGRDQGRPRGEVSEAWLQRAFTTIANSEADLVLVGMGFPLQEHVCAHLAGHLPHGVLIGEGGTFDYEAFGGTQPKAPAAWQRVGLEWLWRLLRQPGRIFRQLAIPRFIFRIYRAR